MRVAAPSPAARAMSLVKRTQFLPLNSDYVTVLLLVHSMLNGQRKTLHWLLLFSDTERTAGTKANIASPVHM